jgi:type II secretory pathway pseudopilin PulG
MTLVELLVALLIMGIVTSAALALVRQQEMAFEAGTGRMDVLQNYRFAAELLERELRTAGSGVVDGQPFLVYADGATLAFNADFATNDTANSFAVYRNPTAPIEEVGALTRRRRLRLPRTSFEYPDSTYRDGGTNSPAETIVFFFAPDTSTADVHDFALFRQVNDLSPAVVARNLLPMEGRAFFEYQEVVEESGTPRTSWVPGAALPLRHTAPVHLSAADVGAGARIDRVRAVRISFASTNGETKESRRQSRAMSRLVSMPNAGVRRLQICGGAPIFLAAVTASQLPGEPRVEVRWSPSADDGGGENDVVRYAIFRRRPGSGDWGEPFFSVPAGLSGYAYTDGRVVVDSAYQYAVSAQDCTPSMSGLRTSGTVTVGVSP